MVQRDEFVFSIMNIVLACASQAVYGMYTMRNYCSTN